jgi:hypothetical protein
MTGGVMFGPDHDLEILRSTDVGELLNEPAQQRDILAWLYFASRVIHSNVKPGWSFDGCSFSQRGRMVLLVVKATHEDTPYVAFTTEQTTTRCVVTFCRRWLEDRVDWHADRFR